jgi:hypothetical protein
VSIRALRFLIPVFALPLAGCGPAALRDQSSSTSCPVGLCQNSGSTSGTSGGTSGGNTSGQSASLGAFSATVALALGTLYGPAKDGFVVASARLDGVAGTSRLQVMVGPWNVGLADMGHAYLVNTGTTYFSTAQLTVPIPAGSYFQILCDGGSSCANGGYLGNAELTFQPVQSASGNAVFGSPSGFSLGQVNGPAPSDGFALIYGRLDGRGGQSLVQINTGATSPPANEAGYGYAYNNGATYWGAAQVMVPVHRGEYYQALCDGQTSCSGGGWLGDSLAYFIPVGSAQGVTALGTSTTATLGSAYTAATDGILFLYGRSDGQADSLHSLQVDAGASLPTAIELGWGYSFNWNDQNGSGYLGSYQLKIPIQAGQAYQYLCDGNSSCQSSSLGQPLTYFLPVSF